MHRYSSDSSPFHSSYSINTRSTFNTATSATDEILSDISGAEFELWNKYEGKKALPGFATNVVLFCRETFVSGSKETLDTERARAVGQLTDIRESEEVKLAKEVCRHLMSNGVVSVQMVSNYQEYVAAVTDEVEQKKDVFKDVVVEELEISTEAMVSKTQNDYADVTVALLLNCRGRCQQRKLWEIVVNAYKASKLGVIIIANKSILTNICCDKWREFVSYVENEGDGWKDHLEIVCRRHHVINRSIVTARDFMINSPTGGCSMACGKMKCGHYCPYTCHAIDPEHQTREFKCNLKCQRTCDFGHICKQDCSEKCGLCFHVVPVKTTCVHFPGIEKQVFCGQRSTVVGKPQVVRKQCGSHSLLMVAPQRPTRRVNPTAPLPRDGYAGPHWKL